MFLCDIIAHEHGISTYHVSYLVVLFTRERNIGLPSISTLRVYNMGAQCVVIYIVTRSVSGFVQQPWCILLRRKQTTHPHIYYICTVTPCTFPGDMMHMHDDSTRVLCCSVACHCMCNTHTCYNHTPTTILTTPTPLLPTNTIPYKPYKNT